MNTAIAIKPLSWKAGPSWSKMYKCRCTNIAANGSLWTLGFNESFKNDDIRSLIHYCYSMFLSFHFVSVQTMKWPMDLYCSDVTKFSLSAGRALSLAHMV